MGRHAHNFQRLDFAYLTAKRFPASTADHHYVRELGRAFSQELGDRFTLVVAGSPVPELKGIPLTVVSAPRRWRTLYYFFWFPLFAARLTPGASVFSNDLNLLVVAIVWRALLNGRYRIVSDWHQLTGSWKDTFVAKRSDALIMTSERLKGKVADATLVDSARMHTVYGGVDLGLYQGLVPSRRELDLPEAGFLVGYIGGFRTMGKEKGIKVMIDALKCLPEDVYMIFVGGKDEELAAYVSYADTHDVTARAIFLPQQPVGRVPAYGRAMDVLAIPYPDEPHFRDYGFPMKVWEYLAAGKPILYSNLEILREVLDGKGEAFTPGNPESFAEAVTRTRARTALPGMDMSAYTWNAKVREVLRLIKTAPRVA